MDRAFMIDFFLFITFGSTLCVGIGLRMGADVAWSQSEILTSRMAEILASSIDGTQDAERKKVAHYIGATLTLYGVLQGASRIWFGAAVVTAVAGAIYHFIF